MDRCALWLQGGGPARLAAKPERSAAQGVRDSNTTGLPCGLLCFADTGRRPLANEPGILDRDMLIGTADQTRLMAIRVV